MKKHILTCLFALFIPILHGVGQVPVPVADPSAPPPIKLKSVTIERASIPGSNQVWTKVIVDYSSEQNWTDGIFFSYEVLLTNGTTPRLLTGGVRYINVTKGDNKGVMYLSPRTTARYGSPVQARVEALLGDAEIGSAKWTAPSAAVSGDLSQVSRYSGILMSVQSTPWLVFDYDKYPDVIIVR